MPATIAQEPKCDGKSLSSSGCWLGGSIIRAVRHGETDRRTSRDVRRSATCRRTGYVLSRDSRTTNHAEPYESKAGHTNRDENPTVAWQVRNERSQSLKGHGPIRIASTERTLVPWSSGRIRASKSAFETGQTTSNLESGPRRKSLTKGVTFALFAAQKVSPKVSPTPEMTQGRKRGLVLSDFATMSCVESG